MPRYSPEMQRRQPGQPRERRRERVGAGRAEADEAAASAAGRGGGSVHISRSYTYFLYQVIFLVSGDFLYLVSGEALALR